MTDIKLINRVLGLRPFIMVECVPSEDNDDGFTMKVEAGGGLETKDEMIILLLLLVEELTGVDSGLYTAQIDAVRKAAGLGALSAEITKG